MIPIAREMWVSCCFWLETLLFFGWKPMVSRGCSRRTFSQGLEIHDAQLMAAISAAEAWQSSEYGDGSKPIIATLITTFILISEDNKHPSPSYFRVPRVQGCPIVLIQSQLSIWLYAYARVHMHVCKYMCIRFCMCIYIYICVCVCVMYVCVIYSYTYIYIYIYVYIYNYIVLSIKYIYIHIYIYLFI